MISNSLTEFALAALACWRIAHLLTEEDGPGGMVFRLRRGLGGSAVGEMLDCFYCASLWAALPLAFWIGQGLLDGLLNWFAISGAACVFQRLGHTGRPGFEMAAMTMSRGVK